MPDGAPQLWIGGDVGLDIVASPAAAVRWGDDTPARVELLPGGQGANVATWARRSGVDVRLFTQVGRDATGRSLVRDLRRRGIAVRARHDARSTYVVSLVEPGRRTLLADIGPGLWAAVAPTPAASVRVGALYLSGYVLNRSGGQAWARAARRWALRAGVPVAVTPSAVSVLDGIGPAGWRALSEGAAWLCMNGAEAHALTGETDPARAATTLAGRGATVLVTVGPDGAWAAAPTEPSRPIAAALAPGAIVDTTGAGDAAAGAFLAHILLGADVWGAAAMAMEAAAWAIRQKGAWAPA